MENDLSLVELVLKASPLVQAVMLILVLASVWSWAAILRKRREFAMVAKSDDEFERRFWSGSGLDTLYDSCARDDGVNPGLEQVFAGGYREFRHLYTQAGLPVAAALESAERGMRAGMQRTSETLQTQLGVLATIGSTSPYIGLFGTVWGIMSAFQALAGVGQATLAMVAPGIAEALIATAMGLFAAIPAVIAYNRFNQRVDVFLGRYEAFAEEFSSLLSRQAHGHRSASPPRAEPVRAVAGERRDGHGDGQRDGRRDG